MNVGSARFYSIDYVDIFEYCIYIINRLSKLTFYIGLEMRSRLRDSYGRYSIRKILITNY